MSTDQSWMTNSFCQLEAKAVLVALEISDSEYWGRWIKVKDSPRVVRVNGVHFLIGDGKGPLAHRGHAGQNFIVTFFNGRVVTTNDLWYQGEIPDTWRSQLPDNANLSAL